MPPALASDERQRVGERRALLVIPRGLPRRAAWLGHPLVGEEGNQRGQPQQRRGGAADRRRGPLALRLDTAVAARLLERDRQLPALHEPPEDPRGRGGLVGAAQLCWLLGSSVRRSGHSKLETARIAVGWRK